MRILLIKPPMVDGSSYYELPLNYAYLAAALIEGGHHVEVVDLQLSGWAALEERLRNGFDLVGTTTYSYSLLVTERICKTSRCHSPDVVIVLGGPHASFVPQESFKRFPEVDAILRGESEDGFTALCDLLDKGASIDQCANEIWNLATRRTLGHVGPRTAPALDSLQLAVNAFHLFDVEGSLSRNPYIPFLASRGCIYKCTFCLSPITWGKMRIRSWENVRGELDIYRRNGFHRINFLDDVFSLLRPILPPLLAYTSAHNLSWGCETRLDDMDAEKIRHFCDSGMDRIRISVETIHAASLKHINKNPRICDVRARVTLLAHLCPDVQVSFMIGIPGETSEQIRATMDFAESLRPANCRFWAYSPLPGTPIYEEPRKHGIVEILEHAQYNPHRSFIETETMTNAEINDLLDEAYQRFEVKRSHSIANPIVGNSVRTA